MIFSLELFISCNNRMLQTLGFDNDGLERHIIRDRSFLRLTNGCPICIMNISLVYQIFKVITHCTSYCHFLLYLLVYNTGKKSRLQSAACVTNGSPNLTAIATYLYRILDICRQEKYIFSQLHLVYTVFKFENPFLLYHP